MQFEDGLINFKILFLRAEKVSEFLLFKSKLFHSMTVDGKKEFLKELFVVMKWGNVTISSGIICIVNARKHFEKILRIMTFRYFSVRTSFTE